MKGCISFSLYGPAARYSLGMWENARLAKTIYPDWTVVVHADRGHYLIPKLRAEGCEVVEMNPAPGSRGMFWRFLPMDWADRFTHVIVRDADSRLNVRDKACTDAWLASGKSLHVIRDNEWHERVAILGGAWGMKTLPDRPMAPWVEWWDHQFTYGDDEEFLGRTIWPRYYDRGDFLRHCHRPNSPDDTPFPPHDPYDGFVCEQIAPKLDIDFRAVLLSPPHYQGRRNRFNASLRAHGGFLKDRMEWQVGTTLKDRVVPGHVDHAKSHPHYHLASKDHIDIIERAILDGVEHLFVFEDDAVFSEDFEEYFIRMWLALPEGWKAAMLGGQPGTDHARHQSDPPHPEALARITGCLGMHGTLWSRAGMIRAFDHFTYWNRMTIDQAFRGLQGDEPGFYAPAKWIVGIDPDAIQFGKDS